MAFADTIAVGWYSNKMFSAAFSNLTTHVVEEEDSSMN